MYTKKYENICSDFDSYSFGVSAWAISIPNSELPLFFLSLSFLRISTRARERANVDVDYKNSHSFANFVSSFFTIFSVNSPTNVLIKNGNFSSLFFFATDF